MFDQSMLHPACFGVNVGGASVDLQALQDPAEPQPSDAPPQQDSGAATGRRLENPQNLLARCSEFSPNSTTLLRVARLTLP